MFAKYPESARGGGYDAKSQIIFTMLELIRYPNRVTQLTKSTLQNGELVSGEDQHVLQSCLGRVRVCVLLPPVGTVYPTVSYHV